MKLFYETKKSVSLLSLFIYLIIIQEAKAQYLGGINDGLALNTYCPGSLNGTPNPLTISAISGPTAFCSNGNQTYSVSATAGYADRFYWTAPSGSTVAEGQGANRAVIIFGTLAGNMNVEASNSCEFPSSSLAVSPVSCSQYLGGNNDGLAMYPFCLSSLNGTPNPLTISAISGPTAFCSNGSETYSISPVTGPGYAEHYYWTGPSGASVMNGQGDSSMVMVFGSAAGNVNVDVSTSCTALVASLAVSPVSCTRMMGGINDGYAVTTTSFIMLPIALLRFTATLVNNSWVLCEWTTATEINNDYFTVEKTKDAIRYEFVGSEEGAGNSNTILYYQLTDTHPYQGTSYYRLKQTDYDGKYTYSQLVPVNLKGINIISIYPNPAENKIEYLIGSQETTSVTINVIDVLGRFVLTNSFIVDKGLTKQQVDVSKLSRGCYALQITTSDGIYKSQKQFLIK